MTQYCQPFLPLGDVLLPGFDSNQLMVDDLLLRFDFACVQKTMQAVGWRQFGEANAPSIETLQSTARALLEEALLNMDEGREFHSGGFRASWHPEDSILLAFEVTSADVSKREVLRLPEPGAVR